MMWESQIEVLSRGSVHRVALLQDGASVSFAEVVDRWRGDGPFRAFFAEVLADAPFEAYFWLSTSGLGIAWLHVRLDERPKYYTHAPYRSPPG